MSDYTEIEEWIAAGTVDCGFVMLPLRTDARLVVRALEEDEFLAVLPRDHELAGAGVFPVERLAEFPLLSPASESDDELLEFLIRWGVRPTTRLTSCGRTRISPHGTIGPSSPWWSTAWA